MHWFTHSNNFPLFKCKKREQKKKRRKNCTHIRTLTETLALQFMTIKEKLPFDLSLEYKHLRSATTRLHSKSIQCRIQRNCFGSHFAYKVCIKGAIVRGPLQTLPLLLTAS